MHIYRDHISRDLNLHNLDKNKNQHMNEKQDSAKGWVLDVKALEKNIAISICTMPFTSKLRVCMWTKKRKRKEREKLITRKCEGKQQLNNSCLWWGISLSGKWICSIQRVCSFKAYTLILLSNFASFLSSRNICEVLHALQLTSSKWHSQESKDANGNAELLKLEF